MGRQGNDAVVVSSSIALLQERFRQLQKLKEMREEKELQNQNMIKEPAEQFRPYYFEPTSRLFFHPESLLFPYSQPSQVSLSLLPPNSKTNHDGLCIVETPLLMNLWPVETPFARTSSLKNSDDSNSDVDTSLHL